MFSVASYLFLFRFIYFHFIQKYTSKWAHINFATAAFFHILRQKFVETKTERIKNEIQ